MAGTVSVPSSMGGSGSPFGLGLRLLRSPADFLQLRFPRLCNVGLRQIPDFAIIADEGVRDVVRLYIDTTPVLPVKASLALDRETIVRIVATETTDLAFRVDIWKIGDGDGISDGRRRIRRGRRWTRAICENLIHSSLNEVLFVGNTVRREEQKLFRIVSTG